jgi:hypothetical protein
MPASEKQSDQHKPRRPRKPKIKSRRSGRGGDHRSLKFQREQSRIDAEVYRLVAEGFQLAQAAVALGISEDAAGPAYRRALASMRLETVAEAKAAALARIKRRRTILYGEIEKRRAAVGGDEKKLIDSGELKMLFDAALALDVRESRLVGTDAPLRSLVGWVGVAPSDDLLTNEQLDRLSIDQLRELHTLLAIARDPRPSIEAASRPVVEPLNFPVETTPAPKAAPMLESEIDLDPRIAEYRDTTAERERDMARLKALHDVLTNRDPLTAIADPIQRRARASEYNKLAARFGAPMWTEPKEPEWN